MTSLPLALLFAQTVLFDATLQLFAVMLPDPLSEIPVPLPLNAMMQPGAPPEPTSAYDPALTGSVVLFVTTLARASGSLVVTVTLTALLPLPVGEVTTDELAAVLLRPFSVATLLTAELDDVLEFVEL